MYVRNITYLLPCTLVDVAENLCQYFSICIF
jgi:hypothetical protein